MNFRRCVKVGHILVSPATEGQGRVLKLSSCQPLFSLHGMLDSAAKTYFYGLD
jgi:hypothetical protein